MTYASSASVSIDKKNIYIAENPTNFFKLLHDALRLFHRLVYDRLSGALFEDQEITIMNSYPASIIARTNVRRIYFGIRVFWYS